MSRAAPPFARRGFTELRLIRRNFTRRSSLRLAGTTIAAYILEADDIGLRRFEGHEFTGRLSI